MQTSKVCPDDLNFALSNEDLNYRFLQPVELIEIFVKTFKLRDQSSSAKNYIAPFLGARDCMSI